MHYVVQLMPELGLYKDFVFFTLEEALEWYRHIDTRYKKLFSVAMDGTRTIIANDCTFHRPFDYSAPVCDIKSLPCRRVKISGNDAWAYLINVVYQYKKTGNIWKLVAAFGNESDYEPNY